jgi:hypothetical protein
VSSQCGCTEQTDCADDNGVSYPDALCSSGLCKCNLATCKRGEACIKNGPSTVCACKGGAACATGQICCSSGCVTGTTC